MKLNVSQESMHHTVQRYISFTIRLRNKKAKDLKKNVGRYMSNMDVAFIAERKIDKSR